MHPSSTASFPPAAPALPPPPATETTGLLLTGGGARAAYQVGVLEAVADLRREAAAQGVAVGGNPFPVITGTSAGAINAAALACGADDFDATVRHIADVWQHFEPGQVYRADALSMLDVAGRWHMLWGLAQLFNRWRRQQPRSLLDNTPLAGLLERMVALQRLPALMDSGVLHALAVTASSYSSGEHYTFYQSARPMQPWVRSQRIAVPGPIHHAHLLASSAIPFVFPATGIEIDGHTEYFGDGSMRQSAPIASAIHLGASRVLVVGAGRMHEPRAAPGPNTHTGYPSLAQIAGHALSSIFLDALAVDIERLQRINQTLSLVPEATRAGTSLRPIELLVISPSERIDLIAARHTRSLPGVVRRMFGQPNGHAGDEPVKASALASYLLFDTGFTRELMALGRQDALAQREAVRHFFGWHGPNAPVAAPGGTGT